MSLKGRNDESIDGNDKIIRTVKEFQEELYSSTTTVSQVTMSVDNRTVPKVTKDEIISSF